jgi:hypothetical protein
VDLHAVSGVPSAPGSPVSVATPDGGVGITISTSSIAFGPVDPGEASVPVQVSVLNSGQLPVTLVVSATALRGPDGATITPSHITVSTSSANEGASLGSPGGVNLEDVTVAPGAPLVLWFTLHVPSGSEASVPAGSYEGSITILGQGVAA